ncbi:hypothetical protein BUY22_14215 [Staphylococcus cohnii]|nr:hypothetical protein BUY22_14215 [Staphylococcus cohnii]
MSELQVGNILNYYLEEADSNYRTFDIYNFEINDNGEGVWNTDYSQVELEGEFGQKIITFNKDIKDLSLSDLRNAVKDLCA